MHEETFEISPHMYVRTHSVPDLLSQYIGSKSHINNSNYNKTYQTRPLAANHKKIQSVNTTSSF